MRSLPIALATVLAMTLAGTTAAGAADLERGRILYEARCGGCHGDSVHGREKRLAADFAAVRGWVLRWSANLGFAWTNDEVDDVTVHLNARYYRFPCPGIRVQRDRDARRSGACPGRERGTPRRAGPAGIAVGPPRRASVPWGRRQRHRGETVMFESAEIGHKLKKSEYKREEPRLRQALLKAQYDLLDNGKFPVVILVNGVDGAGKGETVNLFNEWMDPRHIRTHAFGAMTDAERERPEMWRFWRALPPKGHIGILFGSWYTDPILEARDGPREARAVRAPPRAHPPLRAHARGRGRGGAEALVPPLQAGAEEALQGAPFQQEDGLARRHRRLGALQALRRVRRRVRGRAARNQHRRGAVARDRGLRPGVPLAHRRAPAARCRERAAQGRHAEALAPRAAAGGADRQEERPHRPRLHAGALAQGLRQAAGEGAGAPEPAHARQAHARATRW